MDIHGYIHGYPYPRQPCFPSALVSFRPTPCEYRCHGLGDQLLKDVFHATVIAKLMYCAPAWHGFCSAADRLESFIRRCVKMGYVERSSTVTGMFLEADDVLFHRILHNKAHVLHTFLPDRPLISYSLRSAPELTTSISFAKPVT